MFTRDILNLNFLPQFSLPVSTEEGSGCANIERVNKYRFHREVDQLKLNILNKEEVGSDLN